MTSRAEEAEAALIESVCSELPEHVEPDRVEQGETFVRQFYRWLAPEDLVGRGVHDLLDAALAVWDFARVRAPGSTSVRAYKRRSETGSQRLVTIVEVITDDMPFLADSVGMELSRRGYPIRLSIIPVIDVVRAADGTLVEVRAPDTGARETLRESVMRFEIDRESEPEPPEALVAGVRGVLDDVRAAVEDGPRMRQGMQELAAGLTSAAPAQDGGDVEE